MQWKPNLSAQDRYAIRARILAALGVVIIGAVVALGWLFGARTLESVLPGLATMKFNTALGLMLAGGGVLLVPSPNAADALWRALPALAMGGLAAVLGSLSLAEYIGVPLGLDELVISDWDTSSPYPGRMALATAAGIACAGAAVVLLARTALVSNPTERFRGIALAHLLAAAPAAIGYLSLAGYAYNVEALYSFGPFVSVAIHTAAGLVLLASAILLTLPDLGWRSAFAGRPVARRVFERLIPLSLVTPFLAGLFVIQGTRHHIYDPQFGPALLALVTATTSIGFAWIATIEVRAAEGRVRASDARLRSLVDTAADGIVLACSDGQIQSANPSLVRMFGYDRAEDLIGRNLGVLMPAAEAARHGGYIAAHREGAKPRVIGIPGRELLATRRDGSEFPIDLSVSSFSLDGSRFLTGIIRDATARKRDEAALAQAEARFREIFDSQFQHISLLAPDGTILEINRTALEARGVTRDEAIGRPLWEAKWWPDAERDRLRAEIAQAVQGAVIRREVEIKGAGGRIIRIDFSLKPVRDEVSGRVTSVISEARDQTEKHSLVTQLAQALKVQALGQLSAGIAHDFNNILQAVSGAAALIEQQPGNQDRTRRLAHAAITAAERGTAIVQRLLSFARRGELRTETIATAEALNNIREVLAHTLGTTITVCTKVAPGTPSLIADRAQLDTALVNLATNARDAMPDRGKLVLSAEPGHVAEGERHPAGLAPGDYVRLSVADNGTGMDAATLARMGEPFFTTKPQGEGTGLGLAMVKGFAEQSGGGLSIISTPGAGTTVVIWLRQAIGQVTHSRENEHGEQVAAVTSARILVVDDDDLVREMVAAQLEAAGFATLGASSGIEALALIEAGEVVDAMISDLSMPGMNGVTTIQQARAMRPGLPCFLLTGYVGERAALAADNSFTLVRKPISGRTLAAQIEATLEGARG